MFALKISWSQVLTQKQRTVSKLHTYALTTHQQQKWNDHHLFHRSWKGWSQGEIAPCSHVAHNTQAQRSIAKTNLPVCACIGMNELTCLENLCKSSADMVTKEHASNHFHGRTHCGWITLLQCADHLVPESTFGWIRLMVKFTNCWKSSTVINLRILHTRKFEDIWGTFLQESWMICLGMSCSDMQQNINISRRAELPGIWHFLLSKKKLWLDQHAVRTVLLSKIIA